MLAGAGALSKTRSISQDDTSIHKGFDTPIPKIEKITHTSVATKGSLQAFSYDDLRASTRNFREELGEGGFGVVYKGYIEEKTLMPSRHAQGIPVAIKRLKVNAQQGHREWLVSSLPLGCIFLLVKVIFVSTFICKCLLLLVHLLRSTVIRKRHSGYASKEKRNGVHCHKALAAFLMCMTPLRDQIAYVFHCAPYSVCHSHQKPPGFSE